MKKASTSSSGVKSVPSIQRKTDRFLRVLECADVTDGGSLPSILSPRRSSSPVPGSPVLLSAAPPLPKGSSCSSLNITNSLNNDADVAVVLTSHSVDQLEICSDYEDEGPSNRRSSISSLNDSSSEIDSIKKSSPGSVIDGHYTPFLTPIVSTIPKKTFNLRDRLLNEKHSIPEGTFTRSKPSMGLSDDLDRSNPRHIGESDKTMGKDGREGKDGRDGGREMREGRDGEISPTKGSPTPSRRGSNGSISHHSTAHSTAYSSMSPSRSATPDVTLQSHSRSQYSSVHSSNSPSRSSTPDVITQQHPQHSQYSQHSQSSQSQSRSYHGNSYCLNALLSPSPRYPASTRFATPGTTPSTPDTLPPPLPRCLHTTHNNSNNHSNHSTHSNSNSTHISNNISNNSTYISNSNHSNNSNSSSQSQSHAFGNTPNYAGYTPHYATSTSRGTTPDVYAPNPSRSLRSNQSSSSPSFNPSLPHSPHYTPSPHFSTPSPHYSTSTSKTSTPDIAPPHHLPALLHLPSGHPQSMHPNTSPYTSPNTSPNNGNHKDIRDGRDVDMIGCLQDVETIAARAGDRARKRIQVTITRELNKSNLTQAKNQNILDRNQRSERKALLKDLELKRQFWMTVLILSRFYVKNAFRLTAFAEEEKLKVGDEKLKSFETWAARNEEIKNFFQRNKEAFMSDEKEKEIEFLKLTRQLGFVCRNFLSKLKRHRAATVISGFIRLTTKCQTYGFSSMYVRFFTKSVKLIQRNIRHFLACKEARIVALSIVWNKAERQYIQTMLTPKNDASKKKIRELNLSLLPLVRNRKEVTAIKREEINDKKWSAVENKFQDFFMKSGKSTKSMATMESISEKKTFDSYTLSDIIRDGHLSGVIKELRRKRMVKNGTALALGYVCENDILHINFSEYRIEDAAALISRDDKADIALTQYEMNGRGRSDKKMFLPSYVLRFQMYRGFDSEGMCQSIKEFHENHGTFHGTR